MLIKGLQKLTLLDYPEHLACTVFTGGCNFRCPFCHNASLVVRDDGHSISETELFSFLKTRVGVLDGVCVTGGEPLLHNDIKPFLQRIKELGFALKLDTNGSRFSILEDLINNKIVDYVAMDIKNSPDKYAQTVGLDSVDMEQIKQSVELLKQNKVAYEFRTTVTSEFHTEAGFVSMGEWLEGAEVLYLQGFVDSGDLIGKNITAAPKSSMEKYAKILSNYIKRVELRGI